MFMSALLLGRYLNNMYTVKLFEIGFSFKDGLSLKIKIYIVICTSQPHSTYEIMPLWKIYCMKYTPFWFPPNKYKKYALMLILLLDSRHSWWKYRKTHRTPNNQSASILQKQILYSDVVQVLRNTKPLVSFMYTFCLASTQNWLVCIA